MPQLPHADAGASVSGMKPSDMSNANPTEAMVARCEAWSNVVRNLLDYFNQQEAVSSDASKLHERLARSLNQPQSDQFLPAGSKSIVDVAVDLTQLHRKQAKESAELHDSVVAKYVPKLERLQQGLAKSISDFRALSGNFAQTAEEAAVTPEGKQWSSSLSREESAYAEAIETVEAGKAPSVDPYVLRQALEQKLAHQLMRENKVVDAHAYAKDAIQNVELSVSKEIQDLLRDYSNSLGGLGQSYTESSSLLLSGFVSRQPLEELNVWIHSPLAPPTFTDTVSLDRKSRKDVSYKYQDSLVARPVRSGSLERRTKYLRSFVTSDYVLTMSTLIELKQGLPDLGLDLTEAKLLEDHKHSTADDKFVLYAKQVGSISGRFHTWVFRTPDAAGWKKDLTIITTTRSAKERANLLFPAGGSEQTSTEAFKSQTPRTSDQLAHAAKEDAAAKELHPPTQKVADLGMSDKKGDLAGITGGMGAAGGAFVGIPATSSGPKPSGDAVGLAGDDSGADYATPAAVIDHSTEHPSLSAASTQPIDDSASDVSDVPEEQTYRPHVTPRDEEPHGVGPWPGFGATDSAIDDSMSHQGPLDKSGVDPSVVDPRNSSAPAPKSPGVVPRASFGTSDAPRAPLSTGERPKTHSSVGGVPQDSLAFQADRDLKVFHGGDHGNSYTDGHKQPLMAPGGPSGEAAIDDSSLWSYDLTHDPDTFKNDHDFRPVDAELPPNAERRLTSTSHKLERPDWAGLGVARTESEVGESRQHLMERRRSTLSQRSISGERRGSRRATGSYGGGDVGSLKPLSSADSNDRQSQALFFDDELPKTTSGASHQ